jgi:hypothetical protein
MYCSNGIGEGSPTISHALRRAIPSEDARSTFWGDRRGRAIVLRRLQHLRANPDRHGAVFRDIERASTPSGWPPAALTRRRSLSISGLGISQRPVTDRGRGVHRLLGAAWASAPLADVATRHPCHDRKRPAGSLPGQIRLRLHPDTLTRSASTGPAQAARCGFDEFSTDSSSTERFLMESADTPVS